MAENITQSDLLTQERSTSTSDKRRVLALEMIADQLALIHSDLASIDIHLRGAGSSDTASARDIDRAADDWENEGGHLRQAVSSDTPGITRSQVETFSVGGYKYTNLAHAIAEARRDQTSGTAHD